MSEPCRHERDVVAVHGALGAAQLEIKALRATIVERDASIAQLATRLAADDQDAAIERVRALIPKWVSDRATYPLGSIRASAAFLAVKACEKELTEALDDAPTELGAPCPESCGGQSWTGVDQADGPGKVWRCDTCGRIVSQDVSNPS